MGVERQAAEEVRTEKSPSLQRNVGRRQCQMPFKWLLRPCEKERGGGAWSVSG